MRQCVYCGNEDPDGHQCDGCRQWICSANECEKEHEAEHAEEERERCEDERGRGQHW